MAAVAVAQCASPIDASVLNRLHAKLAAHFRAFVSNVRRCLSLIVTIKVEILLLSISFKTQDVAKSHSSGRSATCTFASLC